ncbi:MAG: hypothetical protein ACW98K_03405 [Candidatus Kariarchaeaceae archaeon]|jgi:hypothetical protein
MVSQIETNDFTQIEGEISKNEVVVRVWRLRSFWLVILTIVMIGLIPFPKQLEFVGVILLLTWFWLSSYLVRQRWRLTLTNKQIVARQLFPRPFTFFSKNYHFPLNQIEGFTIGPRAFSTILLLGLFISSNLGVNLIKSGLSTESTDLPDTVEAFILILRSMDFFSVEFVDSFETSAIDIMEFLQRDARIGLGIMFLIIGIVTVIFALPRRYHLKIRVLHGADFQLAAGIKRSFWIDCYRELYKQELITPPKEFEKWNFPWLKGEVEEYVADLEQTIYLNRFIGIFAIYAGSLRIWRRIQGSVEGSEEFFSQGILLWLVVAVLDVSIAVLGVRFSKRRNELVVTNKRIIFAQEVKDISGAVGKRLYIMSDIERENVAGFNFRKITAFSIFYLLLSFILITLTITLEDQMNLLGLVLAILAILITISFINQTFVNFDINTKGGEIWHMRHQLSNPATMMRRLIGEERQVVQTVMSNRLEEKEIIDTVQLIRSTDLGLKSKFSDDTKQRPLLTFNDLLLQNEEEVYRTSVSRRVPKRVLTLSIASLVFLLSFSLIFAPFYLLSEDPGFSEAFLGGLFFMTLIALIVGLISLWIKYYSLYHASLAVTKERVFFQDIKNPPWWLYYLGVYREVLTSESLRDQIHSTYNSRQYDQRASWGAFLRHFSRWLILLSIWGISMGTWLGNEQIETEESYTLVTILTDLRLVMILFSAVIVYFIAWNAANAFVEIIRAWPRRIFNAQGIGAIHFMIPYLDKIKSEKAAYAIWSGSEQVNSGDD